VDSSSQRPQLPRRFVVLHKRRRFINAFVEHCAEQGYRATTVTQVCARARLARATYYQHFSNLEDTLFAAVEAGMGEASQLVEDACNASAGAFEDRLRASLAALLDLIARRPQMTWVCLVEAPAVRPLGFGSYDAAMRHYAKLFHAIVPSGPGQPRRVAADFVVGGIVSIIRARLRPGEAEGLPALLPELSEFAVAALSNPPLAARTWSG
jgi:AcrR family transcriptional regulator